MVSLGTVIALPGVSLSMLMCYGKHCWGSRSSGRQLICHLGPVCFKSNYVVSSGYSILSKVVPSPLSSCFITILKENIQDPLGFSVWMVVVEIYIFPDHHILDYSWKKCWLGLTAGDTDEYHFKVDILWVIGWWLLVNWRPFGGLISSKAASWS